MRRAFGAAALLAITAVALGTGGAAATAAGTLQLHSVFHVKWKGVDCPAGIPSTTACYSNVGLAVVSGLGNASEDYVLLVEHTDTACADWRFHVVVTVAGKGAFEADAKSKECLSPLQQDATTTFTVSGGSGMYASASGNGTIASTGTETGFGQGIGADTWTGTLSVPGVDFDVIAPTLSGATNRTVRAAKNAKRATVRYTLTARDNVDGTLPVLCKPKSGSLFRVGKTKVTCSAVDRSGNTAKAGFVVTVKR